MAERNWKMVSFWVLGSLCVMFGSMIIGHLDRGPGVTTASYYFGMTISFVLFLLGGLLWISVAIAMKKVLD